MNKGRKKNTNKNAWKDTIEYDTVRHSDHEIGLPENIRVHHNGEANPHDG